jgi:hypothetical protein
MGVPGRVVHGDPSGGAIWSGTPSKPTVGWPAASVETPEAHPLFAADEVDEADDWAVPVPEDALAAWLAVPELELADEPQAASASAQISKSGMNEMRRDIGGETVAGCGAYGVDKLLPCPTTSPPRACR